MKDVVLVSCVPEQRPEGAQGRDLYTSRWFEKARAYAEGHGTEGRWFILSAGHGLLSPERFVGSHTLSVKGMKYPGRVRWAEGVRDALLAASDPKTDRLVMIAGRLHRDPLQDLLVKAGYQVVVPMMGLSISEQLAWLEKQAE